MICQEIKISSKEITKRRKRTKELCGRKEQKWTFIRSEKEHSINHDRNRENNIQGETYNASEKKKREELRQKGPIWMRGTDTDKKGHLTRGIVIGKKDIGID